MINRLSSNQSLKFFESRSVIYLSVSISSCKEQAKSMYILIKISIVSNIVKTLI